MSTLVSVIIATYNSSGFIVETLESIACQTWKELELIISDDCSVDNTVEVCTKWLSNNSRRFTNTELITFDRNTGVSANANRGLYKAKGEWIKFLGADDTLKTKCIEENMSWIALHPGIKVLFSRVDVFKNSFIPENYINTIPYKLYGLAGLMAADRSAESQYKMLLVSDRIHFSPSVFLQREAIVAAGGFDERFKLLEDYPMWLNLTKKGYKLHFMDKITVNYRRHSKAINNTENNFIINPNYFRQEDFRKLYIYPNLPFDIRLNQRFSWYTSQIFRFKLLNRINRENNFLLSLMTIYMNPFRYIIWFRKKYNRKLKENEFYF